MLSFLFFITTGAVQAQMQHESGGHGFMKIRTKKNANMSEVKGSPYLDEEFQYGQIEMEGKEPLNVFLRYDALNENVEIKVDKNSQDTYVLPLSETTVYTIGRERLRIKYNEVNTGGKKITGYFIEHYNGENWRLLEKPSVSVSEAVPAKTGYDRDKPAKIEIQSEYYVIGDGTVVNVRIKHRDIRKAFESRQAQEFLSDNRIRSEEDFVEFVAHLDKR